MRVILLTCGAVLFLTCTSYFLSEYIIFKRTALRQISVLGKLISSNSTAAIAFDNKDDAAEVLASLKAEPHIIAACLYDTAGRIVAKYPFNVSDSIFKTESFQDGYRFASGYYEGFQPVLQDNKRLGTLYLRSDLNAMYERFKLYTAIAISVICLSFILAYLLSGTLQKSILIPVRNLAQTARVVSENHDYSVRATKLSSDELGLLTDTFNHMLLEIERQNLEITSFNQKLEHKVEERTKELELANMELESFSYSVSHDLHAPLRHINNYLNMFSLKYAKNLDEESSVLLGKVLRNVKKMGQLIDDLLTFSRSGKNELEKRMIPMAMIVKSVYEELIKSETGRRIILNLSELPDSSADEVSIRQVWENLISNAIKYTRSRNPAIIEIGAEIKEDEIIYHIRDNGAGFDMEYYSSLFKVFQRLHSQHDFEGTGVGLAIVERIIEKHSGKIWAVGKPDEGAIFYFSLPRNISPLENIPS